MTARTLKLGSVGQDVLELQRKLKTFGFDPGPIDGAFGKKTLEAVKALQFAKSLTVDGQVGPKTKAALFIKVEEKKVELPWLAIAEANIGVAEIPGPKNHPVIVAAHKLAGLKGSQQTDTTAWCSSFHKYVYHEAGISLELLKPFKAWARDWMKFGEPCDFRKGATLVFERNGAGGDSHVTYGMRRDGDRILCLGGNQGNRVKLSYYPASSLLACRWPTQEMLVQMGIGNAA